MPSTKKKTSATAIIGNAGKFVIPTKEEWRKRADAVIKLLDEWMTEDPEYDRETWKELKKMLDEDRPSSRKLFEDES
jgi:hypothetical protein